MCRWGGALAYDGSDYIYAFRGDDAKDFWRYSISGNSWTSMANAPEKVKEGGALAYDGGDFVYALRGNKDAKDFWRYSVSGDSWQALTDAPDKVKQGGALAYDGSSYVYALRGNDSKDFWRYGTSSGVWDTSLTQTPDKVKEGGALAYDGGNFIYAFRGNDSKDFWRYSISGGSWQTLTDAPDKVKGGGALAYDSSGSFVYALRGDKKKDFWRYDTGAGTWDTSLTQTPDNVKEGGALIADGSGSVYALRGDKKKDFWRFDPQGAAPPSCPSGSAVCVDGRLDSSYSFLQHFNKSGSGNSALAPGNLYGYEGTDTCYWAFVVDRAFNDNVYADHGLDPTYMAKDGWLQDNHDFGKLKGSDHAVFDVADPGNPSTLYFDDLTLDYLDDTGGSFSSGLTGKDGSQTAPFHGIEAATSLEWNLEQSGWTSLTQSPPYDWNDTHSPGWEWNMIYEFSIPKSEMGGQCGDVTQSGAHNSPSKDDDTKGKIGDYVWNDANQNGVQDDGGESAGIANVTVNLYDSTDTLIRTTQTAPSGYYIFNNLDAGDYYVEFVLPTGYAFTTKDQTAGGGNDTNDSDADTGTGKTDTFTLASGGTDLTWDAGLYLTNTDFGDLPESGLTNYAMTTFANNGARHTIGTLKLGSSVDAEADGQPNSTATGDGNPDEDGVVRTPGVLWTPGATVSVDVTVTGGNGCLSGWIDWNNDGDFDDTFTSGATEHIITQQLVGTDQGVQPKTFSFLMPTTGSGGDIANLARTFFARFRLYPRDGNGVCSGVTESVTGEASDGEVEDYFWEFAPNAVTLTALAARSSSGFPAGPAAATLAFLAGGVAIGGVLMRRRRAR